MFSNIPIQVNSFQGCPLVFLRLSWVKIWNSIHVAAWLSISWVALTWGVVTSSEARMLKAIPSNMWSTLNTAKASLATVRFAVLPTNSILWPARSIILRILKGITGKQHSFCREKTHPPTMSHCKALLGYFIVILMVFSRSPDFGAQQTEVCISVPLTSVGVNKMTS